MRVNVRQIFQNCRPASHNLLQNASMTCPGYEGFWGKSRFFIRTCFLDLHSVWMGLKGFSVTIAAPLRIYFPIGFYFLRTDTERRSP